MLYRHGLMLFVAVAIGCSSGTPKEPVTPATAPATTEPATAAAPAADAPPPGSKFVCHLDCSGKEVHAYGPTQEEATANARKLVAGTCNPDDGQHFIVCDPVPQP